METHVLLSRWAPELQVRSASLHFITTADRMDILSEHGSFMVSSTWQPVWAPSLGRDTAPCYSSKEKSPTSEWGSFPHHPWKYKTFRHLSIELLCMFYLVHIYFQTWAQKMHNYIFRYFSSNYSVKAIGISWKPQTRQTTVEETNACASSDRCFTWIRATCPVSVVSSHWLLNGLGEQTQHVSFNIVCQRWL